MAAHGLRARSSSFGKNLRMLKGISHDDGDDVFEETPSVSDQNKWLFEVAWEVANKGEAPDLLVCWNKVTKVKLKVSGGGLPSSQWLNSAGGKAWCSKRYLSYGRLLFRMRVDRKVKLKVLFFDVCVVLCVGKALFMIILMPVRCLCSSLVYTLSFSLRPCSHETSLAWFARARAVMRACTVLSAACNRWHVWWVK